MTGARGRSVGGSRRPPATRRSCLHPGLRSGRRVARADGDHRGAADPDADRPARRHEDEGPVGRSGGPRHGVGGRHGRLRHARGPGRPIGGRGRDLRALPDHVDRRRGHLGLQHDRRVRALRRPAAIDRLGLGGSADPGGDDRLLLRHADGGARRLRRPGRDHLGDDGRARLQADQGGGPRPAREHGGRPVRRDRDPRSRRCPR